jgi:hypothetical protein
MEAYWGMEVEFHAFITLALDGCEWSTLRISPQYRLVRWLCEPTACPNAMMKIKIPSPCRESMSCSLARSLFSILTELPRLSYVGVIVENG